jgi:tetratricopeptide (TPR) repeat protein
MPTLPKLVLAILLAAAVPALPQDNNREPTADPVAAEQSEAAPAEASQGGIALEEPARTAEEALERRSAAESEAAKELEAARKAYEDRLAAANQRTVADLTVIARRAVADGKLADASKAWEEVLRLDPENGAAREFFRTIGRLDIVQKRIAKRGRDQNGQPSLSGKWRGRWGTTGSVFHLELGDNGGPVRQMGGRFLLLDAGRAQQLELIPLGDRLVVLGWSTNEGRDPRLATSSIKGLPDHIGFAWPAE